MKLQVFVDLNILIVIVTCITNASVTGLKHTANKIENKVTCPKAVSNCTCTTQAVGDISVNCAIKLYKDIPNGLDGQVTKLNLERNQITRLLKGCLSSAFNLQLLSLMSNNISRIDSSAFDGLISLRKVNFANNPITILHPNMFGSLISLTELNLGNTSLRDAPHQAFTNLKRLTDLYLGSNDILTFPLFATDSNISVVPSLAYLNLNKNQIPFIPFDR